MKAIQEKWLDRIETEVLDFNELSVPVPPDPELEVVRKPDYSNTGRLYVQQDLETLVLFSYSFQLQEATFQFIDDQPDKLWSCKYEDGAQFRRFLAAVGKRIVAQIGDGSGCDHSDTRVCQGMGHATGPDAEPS